MRITIDVENALLGEAMAATGLKTKREVVEAGLRLLVRRKCQSDARALFGCVQIASAWMIRMGQTSLHEDADRKRTAS
jgi:Bacterial antitoxin of type II TA system, VapB